MYRGRDKSHKGKDREKRWKSSRLSPKGVDWENKDRNQQIEDTWRKTGEQKGKSSRLKSHGDTLGDKR